MRGIFTFLVLIAIFFFYEASFAQSYSGTIRTYSNEAAMINNSPDIRFSVNSNFNESSEKGRYYVYFSYSGNFGKIKPGKYIIRILKHIGSRMKEFKYSLNVKDNTHNFHDIIVLSKGVYSIRIYNDDKILLANSDYFSVSNVKYNSLAEK